MSMSGNGRSTSVAKSASEKRPGDRDACGHAPRRGAKERSAPCPYPESTGSERPFALTADLADAARDGRTTTTRARRGGRAPEPGNGSTSGDPERAHLGLNVPAQ